MAREGAQRYGEAVQCWRAVCLLSCGSDAHLPPRQRRRGVRRRLLLPFAQPSREHSRGAGAPRPAAELPTKAAGRRAAEQGRSPSGAGVGGGRPGRPGPGAVQRGWGAVPRVWDRVRCRRGAAAPSRRAGGAGSAAARLCAFGLREESERACGRVGRTERIREYSRPFGSWIDGRGSRPIRNRTDNVACLYDLTANMFPGDVALSRVGESPGGGAGYVAV